MDVSVTLEEVGGFGPGSPRVEQMGEGKGPCLAPLEPSAVPGMQVIKVYSEDGACRSVEVAAGATARYVCEMLVQRSHALSDENWGLVECHPHLALGELGSRGAAWPRRRHFTAWAHRGGLAGPHSPLLLALDPRAGLGGP